MSIKEKGEGKGACSSSEDVLLDRISTACSKFRDPPPGKKLIGGFLDNSGVITEDDPVSLLLKEIRALLELFQDTPFSRGIQTLNIRELRESAQAVFYCLCELFLLHSLAPVDAAFFDEDAAHVAFHEGVEILVDKGLAITVAGNNSDELKAREYKYMLSPYACRVLFRGREELIRPTAINRFGLIVPSQDIHPKRLIFPEDLQDRLRLASRAIAVDQFDRVVKELTDNGLRGGVTAILYDPPGTGKTEFVRQLALSTGRNLFQVDGARMDASYFGEKPRNIRDFFILVKYIQAILTRIPIIFIDEADGLLGRRVDSRSASDKEDNTCTNILLEEMNTFSGILFAATNNIATIDKAMYRRFLMKIEFPVPGRDVLTKIWQYKIPSITVEDAKALTERFPIAGGIIDNVVSLCLVEKIIDGKEPSLRRILQICDEQSTDTISRKRIGFA